ncbi:uncharacterized protein LY89DRAFT_593912, partial [Mollisia scopiformis]
TKMRPAPFAILEGTASVSITSMKSASEYNYYGVLDQDKILEEASNFVSSNSDATKSEVEEILRHFITLTSNDYLEEKRRVFTIRMTKPTDEYTETPRWHRDGRMYTTDRPGEVNSKYATTLLGNPTRIMTESPLVKKVLDEEESIRMPSYEQDGAAYWAAAKEQEVRVAKRLAGQPLVGLPGGSIIKFSWDQVDSPVHSEPDMSTDRVFVSVLYGSEKEMRNMREIRQKEYRL